MFTRLKEGLQLWVVTDSDDIDPTRAQLFRRAIVAGGAIVGAASVWGLPELTSAASKEQDARVLNLVLALEYTEAAFYREALDAGGSRMTSPTYAKIVLEHEQAHVAFLKQALGSRGRAGAAATTSATRPRTADAFAAATMTLEDLAVATYNGQAVNLTPPSLKAAARIVSVEGRHAAWIRSIVGRVPATERRTRRSTSSETRSRLADFGWKAG